LKKIKGLVEWGVFFNRLLNKGKMMKPMLDSKDLVKNAAEFLDVNKPVYVYRNLRKNCWSVRQGSTVRFHTLYAFLRDAKFKVSQAGRERVVKEKRKNVHAFVVGLLTNPCQKFATSHIVIKEKYSAITYNPYAYEYKPAFVRVNDKKSVKTAQYVDMMIDDAVEDPIIAWGVV